MRAMRCAGSAEMMSPWPIMMSLCSSRPAGPAQRSISLREAPNAIMQRKSLISGASQRSSSSASMRRYSAASARQRHRVERRRRLVPARRRAARRRRGWSCSSRHRLARRARAPTRAMRAYSRAERQPARRRRADRVGDRGRQRLADAHHGLHVGAVDGEARQQRERAVPVDEVVVDAAVDAARACSRTPPPCSRISASAHAEQRARSCGRPRA